MNAAMREENMMTPVETKHWQIHLGTGRGMAEDIATQSQTMRQN